MVIEESYRNWGLILTALPAVGSFTFLPSLGFLVGGLVVSYCINPMGHHFRELLGITQGSCGNACRGSVVWGRQTCDDTFRLAGPKQWGEGRVAVAHWPIGPLLSLLSVLGPAALGLSSLECFLSSGLDLLKAQQFYIFFY